MLCIASIHQPRLSAYEMFDRLLLLRKGQLAYGGMAAAEATRCFTSWGYPLPERANPADHFIEVCFGFIDAQGVTPAQPHELADRWRELYSELEAKHEEEERVACEWAGAPTLTRFVAFWKQSPTLRALDEAAASRVHEHVCATGVLLPSAHERGGNTTRGGDSATWAALMQATRTMAIPRSQLPGWCSQFVICLRRYLLKRLRLRGRFLIQLAIVVVLSIIAGIITGPRYTSNGTRMHSWVYG